MIALIKRKLRQKKTRKEFKKKDLANMSIGHALSIVNGPSVSMKEKEQILSNIKRKIESISKMSLSDYLEHMKEKENKEVPKKEDINKSINSESTLDELIEQKLRKFEILVKKDKKLRFNNCNLLK